MKKRLLTILTAVMIASTGLPVAAPVTVYADETEEGTEPQEAEPEVEPEEEPVVTPEGTPEEPVVPPESEPIVTPGGESGGETGGQTGETGGQTGETGGQTEGTGTQTGEGTAATKDNIKDDSTVTKDDTAATKDDDAAARKTDENAEATKATKATDGLVSNALPENGIMLLSEGEDEEETNVQKFIRLANAVEQPDVESVDELSLAQAQTLYNQLIAAAKVYDELTKEEEQLDEVQEAHDRYDKIGQWFNPWRYADDYAGDPSSDQSTSDRRAHLSARDKVIYDRMTTLIKAVADGEETSTVIQMTQSDFSSDPDYVEDWWTTLMNMNAWSSHEDKDPKKPEEEGAYIASQLENWAQRIYEAVQNDNPYYLYWEQSYLFVDRDEDSETITFKIGVGAEYRASGDDEFTFKAQDDGGKELVEEAQQARTIAEAIAAEAYDMNPEDAVRYYNDRVCSLVSYDNKDISDEATPNSMRASNIVNTFDLDPDTNVICAGYSKSMKLLFDFWKEANNSHLDMYYATGSAIDEWDTTPNDDGHAWNIIRGEKANYFIDSTHYDENDGAGTFRTQVVLNRASKYDYINVDGVNRTLKYGFDDADGDLFEIHTYAFNRRGTQVSEPALELFIEDEIGYPISSGATLREEANGDSGDSGDDGDDAGDSGSGDEGTDGDDDSDDAVVTATLSDGQVSLYLSSNGAGDSSDPYPNTATELRKDHLCHRDQVIYDIMYEVGEAVSKGERGGSTAFEIDLDQLVKEERLSDEERQSILNMSTTEPLGHSEYEDWLYNIYYALQDDYPYEFYFDADWLRHNEDFDKDHILSCWFTVGKEYRKDGDAYTFDTSYVEEAQRSLTIAQAIAAEAYDMDAYDAIRYYNDRVCSLVAYDNAALQETEIARPYNLVNTFDLDPDTNIVCAGYSKSMRLLFSYWKQHHQNRGETVDVYLYYVTGSAGVSTLGGSVKDKGHAWNIVHIEQSGDDPDHLNYVVDTTHYDETDGTGAFDKYCFAYGIEDSNVLKDKDDTSRYFGRTLDYAWNDGSGAAYDAHSYRYWIYDGVTINPSLNLYIEREVDAPFYSWPGTT